ncbi:MAG: ester cyclase [Chloroflexota bacterium]|nr:ester cyclase [Chloroflexota bacterium]
MDTNPITTLAPDQPGTRSRQAAIRDLAAGGLAAALLAHGGKVAAQDDDATPVAVPSVVRRWIDAWSSDDPAGQLADLYTDNGVYEDVPSGRTARGDGIEDFLNDFLDGVSDVGLDLRNAFGGDGWAAAEYDFNATDQGAFTGTATGVPFSVRTVTIFELDGDRIRRSSDYYDVATVLGQLGVLPGFGTPAAGTPTT